MKEEGLTLVEVIVAAALIAIIAILLYFPYRGSYRSYHTGSVETNIQENARIAMKRMIKELGAGMVVIPEDSNNAKDESININYGYSDSDPYKIAIYLPDDSDPKSKKDIITFYTALPDNLSTSKQPIDPAGTSSEDTPLLYIRKYTSSWDSPERLIRPQNNLKVTQLNFILGGDNEDKVIITLELAQKEPVSGNWRTYKLVSSVKLGAR